MSFKDKPLKKISADTRVTIDVIHHDITNEFETKRNDFLKEGKLKDYDFNDEVEYYLNTGQILSEYYSKKENNEVKKKEISVLDFMNRRKVDEPEKKNDLINEYMCSIDDTVIKEVNNNNMIYCENCNTKYILQPVDSILLCENCGYTDNIIINSEKVSYKDPPRESSYFAYKRINHFNEWLAQFQAKETTDIPQEVYKGIISELDKNKYLSKEKLTYKNMREILKRLKYNKYYEHIPHIINIINGKKAPILSRQYEERLRIMFKEIQTPFMKHCPENRKNFLSYSYVLHKFCQLLELDELLIYFPLLKSREKLQQQDVIWEKICNTLQWEYIPSI